MANNSLRKMRMNISKYVFDQLNEEAEYCESKVKTKLREELEQRHKTKIYASYGPIQVSGKKVDDYNKKHEHKKKVPYHHTGALIRSVRGVIRGNFVGIELDPYVYENGQTVEDVYEYLDKGTKETDYDVYILGGEGSHNPYVSKERTPKHNFRKATMDNIQNYIQSKLIPEINNKKYIRKTRKGAK